MNLAKEEEESLKEVEEKADEGKLLILRRVLIAFKRVEEQHKEDSLNLWDEKEIIPIPLLHIQFHQKNPQKTKIFKIFSHF